MTADFYRIRRLPPYVFAEVNAMKAAARILSTSAWAIPDGAPPAHVIEKLAEVARNPRAHRYSASRGIPGLRKAQAGYYARRFGVDLVAPDLVPPSLWIDALWGEDEPVFDTIDQFQTVLDSVMNYHNALIDIIDRKGANWRPMFMDKSGTADLEKTTIWVRGFWQAMAAVPASWSALAEHERTQILVEPFATFVNLGTLYGEPLPDNIEQIRRESASLIPRVLPALRKLAQIRAADPSARATRKTGRNETCPCGSGKKYKRCCGLN